MIGECLAQLKFADEIIVLDQGSTDQTSKIARTYTSKVYSSSEARFDKNRNTLVKLAKGKWLFFIDADERIDEHFVSELKNKIKSSNYSAFFVPRKNFILGKRIKHGGWWPDYAPRIFKKGDFIKWVGEVHESPKISGKFGYFETPITHITARNLNLMMAKSIKWAKVEAGLNFNNNAKQVSEISIIKALFFEFIHRYFWKLGFLDGTVGLIEAIYQGFHQAIVLTYLWELQNEGDQKHNK